MPIIPVRVDGGRIQEPHSVRLSGDLHCEMTILRGRIVEESVEGCDCGCGTGKGTILHDSAMESAE
jgi:hypothetical protein